MLNLPEITAHFTQSDGSYSFARWARPIVPVIFGVTDDTLRVFKGAVEAVVFQAGHKMAETDPELGANLWVFFCTDWNELLALPRLGELVPDLPNLVPRLARANQYRLFRFDADGAIKAAFVFLRLDAALAQRSAEDVALAQAVQVMLLWGPKARLLAEVQGAAVLREVAAALMRAAYDPMLPNAAQDPAHALRLLARLV